MCEHVLIEEKVFWRNDIFKLFLEAAFLVLNERSLVKLIVLEFLLGGFREVFQVLKVVLLLLVRVVENSSNKWGCRRKNVLSRIQRPLHPCFRLAF